MYSFCSEVAMINIRSILSGLEDSSDSPSKNAGLRSPSDISVGSSTSSLLCATSSIVEEVFVRSIDCSNSRTISGPIELRNERATLSEFLTLHGGNASSEVKHVQEIIVRTDAKLSAIRRELQVLDPFLNVSSLSSRVQQLVINKCTLFVDHD